MDRLPKCGRVAASIEKALPPWLQRRRRQQIEEVKLQKRSSYVIKHIASPSCNHRTGGQDREHKVPGPFEQAPKGDLRGDEFQLGWKPLCWLSVMLESC